MQIGASKANGSRTALALSAAPATSTRGRPQGYCKGLVGMRITKGHFNEHDAGRAVLFRDGVLSRARCMKATDSCNRSSKSAPAAEQREALFKIMSGENSAEGTLFHIFSLIVTKMHDPIFAPVTFQFDETARTARLVLPGRVGNRGRADQEPGDRRAAPHSSGDAGRFRASRGRGRLVQHPQQRGHQIRDTGRAQLRWPMSCRRRKGSRPEWGIAHSRDGRCGTTALSSSAGLLAVVLLSWAVSAGWAPG